MTRELGRMRQVDIREQWSNEARDFTPWLAEEDNIALLGDALGIELAVEDTEVSVGPYSGPAGAFEQDVAFSSTMLRKRASC